MDEPMCIGRSTGKSGRPRGRRGLIMCRLITDLSVIVRTWPAGNYNLGLSFSDVKHQMLWIKSSAGLGVKNRSTIGMHYWTWKSRTVKHGKLGHFFEFREKKSYLNKWFGQSWALPILCSWFVRIQISTSLWNRVTKLDGPIHPAKRGHSGHPRLLLSNLNTLSRIWRERFNGRIRVLFLERVYFLQYVNYRWCTFSS